MSIITKPLYSLADIDILPCRLTDINSRGECNRFTESLKGESGYLPIIASPMTSIYPKGINSSEVYNKNKINTILPRSMPFGTRVEMCRYQMTAFSLAESESLPKFVKTGTPIYVCIDMANGHMKKEITVGSKLREIYGDDLILMGGNIANPETYISYAYSKFNFVRVGIGDGNACLTSTQSGVHYPMASLLDEIRDIREDGSYKTKVIADGGISNYSDITKCLALGADYVMLGKIFAKAILHNEAIGSNVLYYGMSTKMAQIELGGAGNKTSEGKIMTLQKEYTLEGWIENFIDYLGSAMSYTDSRDLKSFAKSNCQVVSLNSSHLIKNK